MEELSKWSGGGVSRFACRADFGVESEWLSAGGDIREEITFAKTVLHLIKKSPAPRVEY